MIIGMPNFVNLTKACDYYRDYHRGTPAELERAVLAKVADGDIHIGKPDLDVGERLLLIDNGCRYAIERRQP